MTGVILSFFSFQLFFFSPCTCRLQCLPCCCSQQLKGHLRTVLGGPQVLRLALGAAGKSMKEGRRARSKAVSAQSVVEQKDDPGVLVEEMPTWVQCQKLSR